MTKKIITWTDLQGRYRVTSPAYNDTTRPAGETEDECIERVWAKLVASGGYGIPIDHPHFLVEDADQRVRLEECGGTYFRYAGKPDSLGRRDAIYGAWEMDVDGTPKVNMTKARVVHIDRIRVARDAELTKLDVPSLRAVESADDAEQARIGTLKQTLRDIPETFDLSVYATPDERVLQPEEKRLPGDRPQCFPRKVAGLRTEAAQAHEALAMEFSFQLVNRFV